MDAAGARDRMELAAAREPACRAPTGPRRCHPRPAARPRPDEDAPDPCARAGHGARLHRRIRDTRSVGVGEPARAGLPRLLRRDAAVRAHACADGGCHPAGGLRRLVGGGALPRRQAGGSGDRRARRRRRLARHSPRRLRGRAGRSHPRRGAVAACRGAARLAGARPRRGVDPGCARRQLLARDRARRRAGLAELGSVHAPRRSSRRLVCLELRLHRPPLPEEDDRRAARQGAGHAALLARNDPRLLRGSGLGREPRARGIRARHAASGARYSGAAIRFARR